MLRKVNVAEGSSANRPRTSRSRVGQEAPGTLTTSSSSAARPYGVMQVPANGGTPAAVTVLDPRQERHRSCRSRVLPGRPSVIVLPQHRGAGHSRHLRRVARPGAVGAKHRADSGDRLTRVLHARHRRQGPPLIPAAGGSGRAAIRCAYTDGQRRTQPSCRADEHGRQRCAVCGFRGRHRGVPQQRGRHRHTGLDQPQRSGARSLLAPR